MRRPAPIRLKNGYYHVYTIDGYIPRALHVAQKALGKKIKRPAMVHHVNGDKLDDSNQNLVVCQNKRYHNFIHKRTRAYKACGHADWFKCYECHVWQPPEAFGKDKLVDKICKVGTNRRYRLRKKNEILGHG